MEYLPCYRCCKNKVGILTAPVFFIVWFLGVLFLLLWGITCNKVHASSVYSCTVGWFLPVCAPCDYHLHRHCQPPRPPCTTFPQLILPAPPARVTTVPPSMPRRSNSKYALCVVPFIKCGVCGVHLCCCVKSCSFLLLVVYGFYLLFA